MIHLIINAFTHTNPARNAELVECLRINRENPALNVIALNDKTEITENCRYIHEGTGITPGRLLFADILGVARKVIKENVRFNSTGRDIILIANSDIYFDGSVELFNQIEPGECWALSRWENGQLYAHPDSQDVWAFRGAPPLIDADFFLGSHGCDNKLAWALDKAGYRVSNPSASIRCHHLHSSGVRVINRERFTVPGPYKMLTPCTIGDVIAARKSPAMAGAD